MTLTPDKRELAQQIADVLEEKTNSLSRFFGSIYTKSYCCKHLIEPLLGKYNIDTLLESLPPHAAKSLRESYSRLMSCFDTAGELLDKNLSLTTIERYVKDLIKELRGIGQGGKQKDKRSSKKETKKPKPIKERFTFRPGQVLFDDRDLNVGTGATLDIIEDLVKNFSHVVPFQNLDKYSSNKEASEKIRTAIGRLRKAIISAKTPVVIESRKNEGYLMLESTR